MMKYSFNTAQAPNIHMSDFFENSLLRLSGASQRHGSLSFESRATNGNVSQKYAITADHQWRPKILRQAHYAYLPHKVRGVKVSKLQTVANSEIHVQIQQLELRFTYNVHAHLREYCL